MPTSDLEKIQVCVCVSLSLELLANGRLIRTHLIYPHGLILSREKVDERTLKQQVRQVITMSTLDIVPSSLGWICLWLWSVMLCESLQKQCN